MSETANVSKRPTRVADVFHRGPIGVVRWPHRTTVFLMSTWWKPWAWTWRTYLKDRP